MESGPPVLPPNPPRTLVSTAGVMLVEPDPPAPAPGQPPAPRRTVRLRATLVEPVPDEPMAVVVAGPAGSGRSAVLGSLLGATGPVLDPPPGAFVVFGHAAAPAAIAFLPGRREPQPYAGDPPGSTPVPGRPPRRVEVSLPDPLLRHFALIDTPDTGRLDVPGRRVLLDVVTRGGALIFVLAADQTLTAGEFALLTDATRAGASVLFAVTPTAAGTWDTPGAAVPAAGERGPAYPVLVAHRLAVTSALPALAGAPWFAVEPAGADPDHLRRALVGWAGVEGLRRAGARPSTSGVGSVGAGARTVRVAADADGSDWSARLDRLVGSDCHLTRQRLTVELAGLHLRGVQDIVFGGGPANLPDRLDRELHAISLRAVAETEVALTRIIDEIAGRVFGGCDDGIRRRLAAAVRRGVAEEQPGAGLDRVLLVTATAGVAAVSGPGAVAALAAYPAPGERAVLPQFGVALSVGCYGHWHNPANADPVRARAWLQRAVRAVESALLAEIGRRFEAARGALSSVLAEAVDHGILLA